MISTYHWVVKFSQIVPRLCQNVSSKFSEVKVFKLPIISWVNFILKERELKFYGIPRLSCDRLYQCETPQNRSLEKSINLHAHVNLDHNM